MVKWYNKQIRDDRKIDNYFNKISMMINTI